MIVLGPAAGAWSVRHELRRGALQFGIPELTDGIRLHRRRDGRVRLRRDHRQPGSPKGPREVFTGKVNGLCRRRPRKGFRDAPAVLRGTALAPLASCRAAAPAGAFASYTVEEDQSCARAKCRSARATSAVWPAPSRPTTPGADLVHPAADAGHSAQRGDGADGGRDDHPQHPARPQVMTSNPELFWGLIASMWIGNADAGHPEPAADRHVDQAADGALSLAVPGHRCSAPSACIPPTTTPSTSGWWALFGVIGYLFIKLGCEPAPCCWASSWAR